MTALVTTADSLKALTIVRSLGKQGIGVTTGSHLSSPLASYSRYALNNIKYASPVRDSDKFIQNIHTYLKTHPHDVLIPVHSEDTILMNRYAPTLSQYTRLPFHKIDEMVLINDKASLAGIAKELGIPIPKTWIPKDLQDIKKIAQELTFPAVIKLRNQTSSTGQSYAYHRDDLLGKYMKTVEMYSLSPQTYPLIQEYISGDGYGVSLLFNHGDLRARFTHKRIREFPISGGPSTCRVSTRHRRMEGYATRLLKHFNWHGVAMVEFKLNHQGEPFLLEVNPRFWGSINQAVQAGVDFPYLLYQLAVDGDVRPVLSYREGVVTRNSLLDICSYIHGMVSKSPTMNPNPYIQFPYFDDIFSIDDPAPIFAAIKSIRRNSNILRNSNPAE